MLQKTQEQKKIDEENFMNCETTNFSNNLSLENNLILNSLKNKKNSDYASLYNIKNNDFHSALRKDITKLRKDDKLFYRNILNNKLNEFSQTNIFELNFFLKVKYY